MEWCERNTLRRNQNWIGVSKWILEYTREVFHLSPRRFTVIYNPASVRDAGESLLLPNIPRRFILFVGALRRAKGTEVLAQAFRELADTCPDVDLVFAGPDVIEERISGRDRVRRLLGSEREYRAHFLGHLEHDKMMQVMSKAEVLVAPSFLESSSMVALEAMALGVPVVLTSLGPGPEIIENGVTGLLADPNDPSDVAAQIGQILRNPNLAQRLRHRAKETVAKRFNLTNCVLDTLRFYRSVLEEGMSHHGR
mgnify:CR=1 FL=1